ncbi:hypothetical protein HKX48_006307, partial [Thoreauomyces humboldtii]
MESPGGYLAEPTAAQIAADAAWRHDIVDNVRKVYSGVAAVYLTFITVTAVWFAWRTRKDATLAKRSVLLTMVGFVGNFCISFPFLCLQATRFPCFLILCSLYLGVSLTVFSLSARAWRLRYLFREHQQKLTRMRALHEEHDKGSKAVDIDTDADQNAEAEEGDDMLEPLGTHRGVVGSQALTLMGSASVAGSTNLGGGGLVGSTTSMTGNPRGGRTSSGHLSRVGSGSVVAHGRSPSMASTHQPWASPLRTVTSFDARRHSDRDASLAAVEEGHGTIARRTLASFSKKQTQMSFMTPAPLEEPTRRFVYILLTIVSIVAVYVGAVLSVSKQYSPRPISYTCEMGVWEMVPVLVIFGSFLFVGCPALCWWLWNDKDTYGIRRDLTVFAVAGTLVAIMYGLEQVLIPTGQNYGDSTARLYFGASNWPVIGVGVGHFTSIVFPLLGSYGIFPGRPFERLLQALYRSPSGDTKSEPGSMEKLEAEKVRRTEAAARSKKTKRTRKAGRGRSASVTWTLFQSVLEDRECFEALKGFAARDFAAENPLFYQEYKKLMQKVRAEQDPDTSALEPQTSGGTSSFLPPGTSTQHMNSVAVLRVESTHSANPDPPPQPLTRTGVAASNDSVADKYPV